MGIGGGYPFTGRQAPKHRNKGEKHMQTRTKIKAVTSKTFAAGKFQTE